jgi:hypothetical protein
MGSHENALPLTLAVPEYGRLVFNIGEASSYAAADRGDIPTIEMGRLRRVPVRIALRRLAGDDVGMLEALTKDLSAKLERSAA